jgi:hypothetical protein
VAGASTWVVSYSCDSPGLLVSAIAGRVSVTSCGWVVV